MIGNKKVLKSKLRFSGAPETIIRERLMPVLSEIPEKRLTMVIAGAGYGKTTLVQQALDYLNLPALWYRLDKYDSDFDTFFSYLKTGVEEHLGTIEIAVEDTLQDGNKVERILHCFLEEIENRIEKDFFIVLDDYYLIHDNEEINRAVKFIIDNMHNKSHLVLISRSEPPIKISSLRVKRDVLDIAESDLAFTVSEIKKLYLDVFHLSLKSRTFDNLQKKTDGWAAALILFFHSLKGKSQETADEDLLKIEGSHRVLATYLEENAYEMLSPETREFLEKTSLLSKLKVDFCNQLLKINNSEKVLSDLAKGHLFTFQLANENDCYTYHHIFQDFLRAKLNNNYCRDEVQELQKKIAQLLEQDGNEEEALEYYLESEQMEDSFRIIGEITTTLLLKGQLQRFKSYIKRIPPKYFQKEPWIKFLKANWLILTGKKHEAVQCLEQSCEAFIQDNVPHGAALCLQYLGYNYFIDGDFPRSERTFQRALTLFQDNTESSMNMYLYCIDSLSMQGKFKHAEKYYNTVLALLINKPENEIRIAKEGALYNRMGNLYNLSGDFHTAIDFLQKSNRRLEHTDYYALQTNYYFTSAQTYYYQGHFSEGFEISKKALKLAVDKGFDDFFPSAWLHYSAGRNSMELGKSAEAMYHIKTSFEKFENIGSYFGQASCYIILYQLHKRSGQEREAARALSQCEIVRGSYKIPWVDFYLKIFKADYYIKKKDFQKAHELLDSAGNETEAFKYMNNQLNFVWALYYWVQDNKEMALQKLLKGIKSSRENKYNLSIIKDIEGLLPILLELFSIGKESSYIKKIFNQIGIISRFYLIDLQKSKSINISKAASEILSQMPAPPLMVYCLGEFKLYRGNIEISAEKWTNQKAKLLFKYLLAERDRGFIPKEILIEMLWPEEDINKTTNRLRVTLSALRKSLEPELIRGGMSSYILNDNNGYKLHIGKDGDSDIDAFRSEIRLAKENKTDLKKSIHNYIKAESLYKGAFLTEDPYVDWVTEKREYFQKLYLHAIIQIISYYEQQKDFLKCIEYSNKYLQIDVYAETVYQKLMKYYSYTGNNTMIQFTYEKCKQSIVNDLCSPLNHKTESIFNALLIEKTIR